MIAFSNRRAVDRTIRDLNSFSRACQTPACRNIFRKAVQILCVKDDYLWLKKAYKSTSTQTDLVIDVNSSSNSFVKTKSDSEDLDCREEFFSLCSVDDDSKWTPENTFGAITSTGPLQEVRCNFANINSISLLNTLTPDSVAEKPHIPVQEVSSPVMFLGQNIQQTEVVCKNNCSPVNPLTSGPQLCDADNWNDCNLIETAEIVNTRFHTTEVTKQDVEKKKCHLTNKSPKFLTPITKCVVKKSPELSVISDTIPKVKPAVDDPPHIEPVSTKPSPSQEILNSDMHVSPSESELNFNYCKTTETLFTRTSSKQIIVDSFSDMENAKTVLMVTHKSPELTTQVAQSILKLPSEVGVVSDIVPNVKHAVEVPFHIQSTTDTKSGLPTVGAVLPPNNRASSSQTQMSHAENDLNYFHRKESGNVVTRSPETVRHTIVQNTPDPEKTKWDLTTTDKAPKDMKSVLISILRKPLELVSDIAPNVKFTVSGPSNIQSTTGMKPILSAVRTIVLSNHEISRAKTQMSSKEARDVAKGAAVSNASSCSTETIPDSNLQKVVGVCCETGKEVPDYTSDDRKDMKEMYVCEQRSTTNINDVLQIRLEHDYTASLLPKIDTKKIRVILKPYKCLKCGGKFSSISILSSHRKFHNSVNPDRRGSTTGSSGESGKQKRLKKFPCSACNKFFWDAASLEKHFTFYHIDKPYKCSSCPISFNEEVLLKTHEQVHTVKKPYTCMVCNNKYSTEGRFYNHIISHASENGQVKNDLLCTYCNKVFATSAILEVHTRVHTGEKPHKCHVCGKSYSQMGTLNVHLKSHTGNRSYLCEICGKASHRRSDLTQHQKTHRVKDRHACHVCGKVCVTNFHLNLHLTSHNRKAIHLCDVCGRKFDLLSRLHRHKKNHKNSKEKPYVCDKCGCRFKRLVNLKFHLKSHSE